MRTIFARFSGRCAETGARIPKGKECLYDPQAKKVYSLESNKYKEWISGAQSAPDPERDGCPDPGELYFENFCQVNNI
jgi:hypothetical protein